MLNLSDYTLPQNIWNGISRYVEEHFEKYQDSLPSPFTDDDLLKALKKSASKRLPPKEYDTFRKAATALRKGTAATRKFDSITNFLCLFKLLLTLIKTGFPVLFFVKFCKYFCSYL